MWIRFLFVSAYFLFTPLLQAEEDWHEDRITYEVKEKTRFYQTGGTGREPKAIFIAFDVPAGFTLEGCSFVSDDFLKGKTCGNTSETYFHRILEKGGIKRKVVIDVGGGVSDLKKIPLLATKDGRYQDLVKRTGGSYPGNRNILKKGDFVVVGKETGRFTVRKVGAEEKKGVIRYDGACEFGGSYHEEEVGGGTYIEHTKWLFEDIFDGLMRDMACERVDRSYLGRRAKRLRQEEEKKKKSEKGK